MAKKFPKGRTKKLGLPPGSFFYSGDPLKDPIEVTVFDYDMEFLEEKVLPDIEGALFTRKSQKVSWIDVIGIHNSKEISRICRHFEIHPLTIEDVLNNEQRPKIEDNLDYVYLVLKMIRFNEDSLELISEQVSLILGKRYVLCFQEKVGDTFEPVRNRIRNGQGRIRNQGADYLMYALLDTIVDHYFVVLEKMGDKLEELEDEMLENPTEETFNQIHRLKKEIISLRRSVWPLRDVISKLDRENMSLITRDIKIYSRDVYDHIIQIIDTVENYRDILAGLVELYQSMSGNKMNEVMKVLTIISTIFIPLTFITGLYGMNFENIPELSWRYGYFMVWGVSILVVTIMLIVFRKKKWI